MNFGERATLACESELMGWWKEAFGAWYPIVYTSRDDESAHREVASAATWLSLLSTDRVLDLACGGGRHARALARRVQQVIGCDLSMSLLRSARDPGGGPHYLAADQRQLPFASASFDVVTCFFTSFGYGESVEHDRVILNEVRRVLRPKGRFLLDLPDPRFVRDHLVPESTDIRGDYVVKSRRTLNGNRVQKDVTVLSRSGVVEASWQESVRLYDGDEVNALLHATSLTRRATYSSFDAASHQQDRHIVIAEAT